MMPPGDKPALPERRAVLSGLLAGGLKLLRCQLAIAIQIRFWKSL